MSDTRGGKTKSRAWIGLGLTLALVATSIVVGRWMRTQLQGDSRYQTAIDALDCDAPPGLTREAFLAEVRYLNRDADGVSVLDAGAADLVRGWLTRHPWVEAVDQVVVEPTRRIRVEVRFRRPALAVPYDGGLRVVDRHGVLLPRAASAEGLPRFRGTPRPPSAEAGQVWADPEVVRQAAAK